jgi:hypothetical protein
MRRRAASASRVIGIGGMLAAGIAAALLLTTRPATAQAPAQISCSSGYVEAIIGGESKCLHAGEFCAADSESDYERYGFSCISGHLQARSGTPSTTTAPTTTTAPITTASTTTTQPTTSTARTTTAPTTTAPPPTRPTTTTTNSGGAGSSTIGRTVLIASRTQRRGCTRGQLPDRQCSPGAVYSDLTKAVLCAPAFHTGDIRNVPDSEKHQVEIAYGMTPKAYGRTIEIDHIISLEIGGSNDIANLYPEPGSGSANYHDKDKLENRLHAMVCAGSISLTAAQHGIAGNWKAFFKNVFGSAP